MSCCIRNSYYILHLTKPDSLRQFSNGKNCRLLVKNKKDTPFLPELDGAAEGCDVVIGREQGHKPEHEAADGLNGSNPVQAETDGAQGSPKQAVTWERGLNSGGFEELESLEVWPAQGAASMETRSVRPDSSACATASCSSKNYSLWGEDSTPMWRSNERTAVDGA